MIQKLWHYILGSQKNDFSDFISQLNEIYKHAPVDFGGGCSYEKALTLAFLIKNYNLKNSADIGVYRGRSLFPQSLSHKINTNGIAYAIDPYDSIAAIQVDRQDIQDKLIEFVQQTNFNIIYEEIKNIVDKFNLKDNTIFIREKSHDAAEYFRAKNIKLGLVHIDGNHDTKFVMQDVYDYITLLDEHAFIILDDITWESVKPAYDYLRKHLIHVGECVNTNNDYAVFTNTHKSNSDLVMECRNLINTIKKHVKN
jgi:predicted O-methyltransferase YrrM